MTKLSHDEVRHIAKLARLSLTDEEVGQFTVQLSEVLEYVEKLQEIDTEGVAETSQVTGLEDVYRPDEQRVCEEGTQLIEQAPMYEDNQVKVPKVL